jgi:hypothetical protein
MAYSKALVSPDGRTIFVGVEHDAIFKMQPSLFKKILDSGKSIGFWYEGDGSDKDKIGRIPWKGSWDDLVESGSSDFYYTLFSNSISGTSKMIARLVNPNQTIFDVLADAGGSVAHEALRGSASPRKLEAFLIDVGGGLLEEAKNRIATQVALKAFFQKGTALMWPNNWSSAPTKASRVALRANKTRLNTILQRPGVFFLGKDHLKTLQSMRKDLVFMKHNTTKGLNHGN